jgi:hypothetical protein
VDDDAPVLQSQIAKMTRSEYMQMEEQELLAAQRKRIGMMEARLLPRNVPEILAMKSGHLSLIVPRRHFFLDGWPHVDRGCYRHRV